MVTSTGERRMVQILSVDPVERQVQIRLKDRGTVAAHILEVPNCFVWPQSGENWMVERKKNTWYLVGKIEGPDDAVQLASIPLGDGLIEANNVRLKDGDYVVDSKLPLPLVITGSRASGAALVNLLDQLEAAGIITDNTTP
jgi:hypothetical protein